MMAFSATDAVFEGFRVVRRRPSTLIYWTLFYIAAFAVTMALVGGDLIRLIAALEVLDPSGATSPEELMPVMQLYANIFAVVLPVSLIASAVLYTAVSRAVLQPEEDRFGYIRLGADELRVLTVVVALGLLFMALMVVSFALVGLIGGIGTAAGAPWLWPFAVLLGVAAVGACIWLAIRLSLAVPITVAERRIAIFDSWRLTRGVFWPLLGMAVLAGVLGMVVALLGSLVLTPLQLLGGGLDQLEGVEGEGLAVVLRAAWPAIAVFIVSNAFVSALQVAVIYGPFSAAYRAIAAQGPRR
jgi:hypothetical protein